MALSGAYTSFSNADGSGNLGGSVMPPALTGELDLRLYRIFSIFGVGGQSEGGRNTFAGGGVRIDLPGFFLIGANNYDLFRSAKKTPFNTSLHGGVVKFTEPIVVTTLPLSGLCARGGLTLDWVWPAQTIFMTFDASLFIMGTDSFVTTSAGLGLQL